MMDLHRGATVVLNCPAVKTPTVIPYVHVEMISNHGTGDFAGRTTWCNSAQADEILDNVSE
jgi:hypothetical protein